MAIRPKAQRTMSIAEIGQLTFNERSGGNRNVSVGGAYDILGAIGTAVRCGTFASLMIANTTAIGHFVKFGDSTVAAPTGVADGVYLPPYSNTFVGSGLFDYVRADVAGVAAYKLQDFIAKQDDANIAGV